MEGWNLDHGTAIADGRTVVELMRVGRRYEVYLVWDSRLYALAVAKVLRPDRLASARAQQRMRDEASLLARLAHPAIARSFGGELDGKYPHFVLEHVDAPSLRQLVRAHGPLPHEQIAPLGLQTAAALHYLAGERVVHLDVKPSNVLMSAPPRLIDFGGARSIESAVELRRPVGTALYMAPEVCRLPETHDLVGAAADVWSLGATLYYGLAGAPPFPGADDARHSDDPLVRFPQLVDVPAPLTRGVPPALEQLVLAMLASAPSARPTAAEAADTLSELLD